MTYKVKVNDDCIGCGACVGVCEEVFELKDGKSVPKMSETEESCVKEAQEVCPVNAIEIEEQ